LVTATVASRLSSLLFKHKLVDPSHFGFLQGGSVSIPIRILTTLYERARAEHTKTGDGNDCHAGLLDLVSAFDNVSHALLEAAFARIGAPPAFCHWIRNLLHNQRRFVSTAGRAGSSNESFILEGGLPQGCASSPILFVIYFDVLIVSLHAHMGAPGCTLGNALIQSIVLGDDCTIPMPTHAILQTAMNCVGPDSACLSARCNYTKSLNAAGTTPVVPKPIFLPSLNEHGIFSTGELPTILPNRPPNTTKDPTPYFFRIRGVLLQRGETTTHGPWCPQTAAIRNRIAAFASLAKALPFSFPESKLALSSHFIPKSCFSLSKVLFDIDLIYEVQAICTAVSLSSAGIDTLPNQNIMTTAAMVSHNGTFTGIDTPDPLTWILRGHASIYSQL
jgi:hypothetical protein